MWYVYIIKSVAEDWTYVGYTQDLRKRLSSHNNGKNRATKPYAPLIWQRMFLLRMKRLQRNLRYILKPDRAELGLEKDY